MHASEDVSRYTPPVWPELTARGMINLFTPSQAQGWWRESGKPKIENAMWVESDEWPKSFEEIAPQLGVLAAEKLLTEKSN